MGFILPKQQKGKKEATSCEILVASSKCLVALVTRKAQFRTLYFNEHTSAYAYRAKSEFA